MAFIAQQFRDIYFPYRIFTLLIISFLLGIFLASFFSLDFSRSWLIFIYIISALLLTGLFNYFFGTKPLILLSFCLLSLSLGSGYYSFREWKSQAVIPFDKDMRITGVIATRPEIGPQNQKITLRIKNADTDSFAQKNLYGTKIIVSAPVFPEYHFGQILIVAGKVSEAQNFSDFDYKGYLKHLHVVGEIKFPGKIEYMGNSADLSDRIYARLYGVVDLFESKLNAVLPEPHSSLAAGILLGIKRNIPDRMMSDLQKTGLTHIIALSGFNITILMAVFAGSLTIYLGQKYTFLIGLFLILVFVLMTGASASVIRAAVLSALVIFGKTIGKRGDQLNLILLVAFIMVLANPYLLAFDLGFQLSFLAFLGLVFVSPYFAKFFDRPRQKFIPALVKRPLAETLGAQLTVFPLILAKFGIISIISPFANILVIWTIPLVMFLTFITGVLAMIATPLGKVSVVILWPALEYIIKVVEVSANLPFSSVKF